MPQLGVKRDRLKRMVQEKLIEHRQYIDKKAEEMPEIHHRKWGNDQVSRLKAEGKGFP